MSDPFAVSGRCQPRFERVRELFQQSLSSGTEIGAAVAFVLDGECVVDLWGGHYDLDRARPWERDTLVNVYSTTKGMTALCANQLIERGLLELDAPVAHYWPEFAAAGKAGVTVRWLQPLGADFHIGLAPDYGIRPPCNMPRSSILRRIVAR